MYKIIVLPNTHNTSSLLLVWTRYLKPSELQIEELYSLSYITKPLCNTRQEPCYICVYFNYHPSLVPGILVDNLNMTHQVFTYRRQTMMPTTSEMLIATTHAPGWGARVCGAAIIFTLSEYSMHADYFIFMWSIHEPLRTRFMLVVDPMNCFFNVNCDVISSLDLILSCEMDVSDL